MTQLSAPQLRQLRAQAQRLVPSLKIGKAGLTEAVLAALDAALEHQPLVKIRFDQHKEEKHALIPLLVDRSRSQLVLRVGNVAVLYRPKPTPAETAPSASPDDRA